MQEIALYKARQIYKSW